MSTAILERLATITRRTGPRGIHRVLRWICSPKRADGHFTGTTAYRDGLRMCVDTRDHIEWHLFFYGEYEGDVGRVLKMITSSQQVVIDVGANVGVYTLPLSRHAAQVLAVEPNPRVAERLDRNLRLNNIDNVTVVRCALSNDVGESKLFVPCEAVHNCGMSSLHGHSQHGGSIRVDRRRLDDVVRAECLRRVDFIKIGHEFGVLLGAEGTLRMHLPTLLFEFDPDLWTNGRFEYDECARWLTSIGYVMPPKPDRATNVLAVPSTDQRRHQSSLTETAE